MLFKNNLHGVDPFACSAGRQNSQKQAKLYTKKVVPRTGQPFLTAPQVGFEPTTLSLTAICSTIELLRNGYFYDKLFL